MTTVERHYVEEFLRSVLLPTTAEEWPEIRKRQAEFVELYGGSFEDGAAASERLWCGSSPGGWKIGFRFWRDADNFVDVTLPIEVALALKKNIEIAVMIAAERNQTLTQTGGNA